MYLRLPEVETQITRLVALSPRAVVARATAVTNFRDAAYVRDETLAYFLREWHRTGATEGFGELVAEMQRRVEGRVRSPFRLLAELVREEATNRVIERLWTQLFTLTSARGEYLQVRFGLALKRMILDTRTQMYDASVHEAATVRDTRSDHNDGGYNPLDSLTDAALALDARYALRDELRDALNAITDERHREAFVLRYVEQWPVEGDTPLPPSVTTSAKRRARYGTGSPMPTHNSLTGRRNTMHATPNNPTSPGGSVPAPDDMRTDLLTDFLPRNRWRTDPFTSCGMVPPLPQPRGAHHAPRRRSRRH